MSIHSFSRPPTGEEVRASWAIRCSTCGAEVGLACKVAIGACRARFHEQRAQVLFAEAGGAAGGLALIQRFAARARGEGVAAVALGLLTPTGVASLAGVGAVRAWAVQEAAGGRKVGALHERDLEELARAGLVRVAGLQGRTRFIASLGGLEVAALISARAEAWPHA